MRLPRRFVGGSRGPCRCCLVNMHRNRSSIVCQTGVAVTMMMMTTDDATLKGGKN